MMFTIGGEADRGALLPLGMSTVQTGVAALVLDGDRLDGELTDGQRGAEPDPPLVWRLYHGIAPLGKGGHICGVSLRRGVPPHDLVHLFRQTVGAREGGPLAADRRLIAVDSDTCWEPREPTIQGRNEHGDGG